MDLTKVIFGTVVGAMFTAIAYVILSYFITDLGISLAWLIGAAYFAVFGAIIGGIAGAIIVSLNLNLFTGMLFGLLFNLFISIILFFVMGSGRDNELYYAYIASIIIGAINGAVVPLIVLSQKSLK
jgi:hypothetical protein